MTDSIGIFIPILGIMCGIIAIVGGIWIKNQKLKLEMMREQGGTDALANKVTQAELEKLRDRVAVLERLLTDDDRRLANEISRLQSTEVRR
jgi:precorrin-6B methylase 1